MERTLENVHVVIYSKKMLKEAIKRLNNHGQNIETDIMCDYEFHGNDLLIYHDGLFKVIQFLPTHPNHEVTLNDLCEMIIDEESKPIELTIGKWYFIDRQNLFPNERKALVFFKGHGVPTYGFRHEDGFWTDNYGSFDSFCNSKYKYSEATRDQIEHYLTVEAESRYKIGDRITLSRKYFYEFSQYKFMYFSETNALGFSLGCGEFAHVFKDGKWAEITKEEKLKIGDWIFVALENDPQQGFTVFQILEQHTADTHNSDMYKTLYVTKKIDKETAERLRKEFV